VTDTLSRRIVHRAIRNLRTPDILPVLGLLWISRRFVSFDLDWERFAP